MTPEQMTGYHGHREVLHSVSLQGVRKPLAPHWALAALLHVPTATVHPSASLRCGGGAWREESLSTTLLIKAGTSFSPLMSAPSSVKQYAPYLLEPL